MHETDKELVDRAVDGDRAAIGELFSRYWRAARAAAFGVTGEIASAEDAAADGFRAAWAGLESLRDRSLFGPWLRTIVLRKARGARRRSRATTPIVPDGLAGPSADPDDVLQRLELGAVVQQLVRELPPRLREAVSLFYFEGYGSDECARFLGIPPGTLRRRLHEARRQLGAAAERVLNGSKAMSEQRERQMQDITRLIERAKDGDSESVFQAFRGALASRPVPTALIEALMQHRSGAEQDTGEDARRTAESERIRRTVARFMGPSSRASDPNDPVGSIVVAIRAALPGFEEWTFDAVAAASQVFMGAQSPRPIPLPPGFAEGRPGAFFRVTRALLPARRARRAEAGSVGPALQKGTRIATTYELLRDSANAEAFRDGLADARIGDALDLTWLTAGALELRDVHALLERTLDAVLPSSSARFVPYDEPRYRSALRLQFDGSDEPAAVGGVLTGWPGKPECGDAAHVRIFLEEWARLLNS